jgi:tetratricopeptide (TPR) repeat protein
LRRAGIALLTGARPGALEVSMLTLTILIAAACGTVLAPPLAAAALEESAAQAPGASVATPGLEPWQRELLEVAFGAASAMPLVPHHKNRARAQLEVVEACLALDQPDLALAWAGEIGDWRRGEACASIAQWLAGHGRAEEAQQCLQVAGGVLEGPSGGEDWQVWQRDRIRARIASTHMVLGQADEALRFAAGLSDSELGPVAEQRAAGATEEEADAFLGNVDQVFATGSFEQVRAALTTCAGLADRFHGDAARRVLIDGKIRAGWDKMPVAVRLEVLDDLSDAALRHGDRNRALSLLDEARPLATGAGLLPEARVPLRARLALLRWRAGDTDAARVEADEALVQFEAELGQVLGTERADVLRPLAEAYQAMGDRDGALRVYRRAVELGVVNPNARPRAEDLAATCCSLARAGLQPDEALQARLLEVRAALGPPW